MGYFFFKQITSKDFFLVETKFNDIFYQSIVVVTDQQHYLRFILQIQRVFVCVMINRSDLRVNYHVWKKSLY